MAAVKSFLSSLTSFPGRVKSSESTPASGSMVEKAASDDVGAAKYHQSYQVFDIDEAYVLLQNGVLVDHGRQVWVPLPPGLPVEGGIVRIVACEQTVRPLAV